jgi:hypothetical protein
MRDSVQNQLELASAYLEAGLAPDAEAVLADASAHAPASGDDAPFSAQRTSPMLDYLLGYVALRRGDASAARACFARAAERPLVYANPHRVVEAFALEAAIREDPQDAHAHHLLGNALYGFGRREDGLAQWREATRRDPGLALAWRNVGYAEHQLHADDKAAALAYRNAFAADASDARVLLELDQVQERLRVPAAERLALLDAHRPVVDRRDDLVMRWIDLKLAAGAPAGLEAVRDVLLTRHFHSWEGLYGIHHAFMEVQQRLGDLALARKDLKTALARYRQAFEYPKNLEVAPRTPDFRAHLEWSVANAYLATRHKARARPALDALLKERYPRPGLGTYYQSLAQRALGRSDDAARLLQQLEERARTLVAGANGRGGRSEAAGEYLLGLVLEARGDGKGAAEARSRAEELDPHPARAALTLAQVEYASAHQ